MYVRVKTYPGCKKELVVRLAEHRFEIHVKAPAEQNLANRRVQELLAVEYNVTPRAVRLVSGHRTQTKIFDVINQ